MSNYHHPRRARAERLAATDPCREHDWVDCLMGTCR